MATRLTEMGIESMSLGIAPYEEHVKIEREKWFRVIKAAGTRLD